MAVTDWSELTDEELRDLVELAGAWQRAHDYGDYKTSDALRAELIEWGAWPPEHGWHPVFESVNHRQKRISARAGDG